MICCVEAWEHSVGAKGEQWYGQVLLWQDGTSGASLSASWDEPCQQAWFLISEQPAGKLRVKEDAWRMRVAASFPESKSRGWDLQASLITDLQRLNRLLLALFLAHCWGMHLAAAGIHHGHRHRFDRGDKGIFRLGRLWVLDILRRARTAAALIYCLPFQKGPTRCRFAWRF
jgi:hypothetical protein